MTAARLLRLFTAARTTVLLLCALAILLLLNVLIPQAAVLGEDEFARMAGRSGWNRLVLVDLGLGRLTTSPLFLALIGLFFLNLAAVLASRIGPTWQRLALKDRTEAVLASWTSREAVAMAGQPEGWNVAAASRILGGFGYRVRRPGVRTLWGVKHRTAPLGFILFHVSFFLICAGGALLYYTRFVGAVTLSEGQRFDGDWSPIERRPPMGGVPSLAFTLEKVEARLDRGEPTDLAVTFRMDQAGAPVTTVSRVNHPVGWGRARLMVDQAGLAPQFWLQDSRGYTLDRVVVPARSRGGDPTEIDLKGGWVTLKVFPLGPASAFPGRDALRATALRVQALHGGAVIFDAPLRPGDAVALPVGRLLMEEMRYWARVRVVSERGGGILVAGFVIGIAGLAWRLLLYRREVVVHWDGETVRLAGRGEYYSARFEEEMRSLFRTLTSGAGAAGSGPAREGP